MNSMAQHAVPKGIGQIEDLRPHFVTASRVVGMTFPPAWALAQVGPTNFPEKRSRSPIWSPGRRFQPIPKVWGQPLLDASYRPIQAVKSAAPRQIVRKAEKTAGWGRIIVQHSNVPASDEMTNVAIVARRCLG